MVNLIFLVVVQSLQNGIFVCEGLDRFLRERCLTRLMEKASHA